jgi:hypothetical protein
MDDYNYTIYIISINGINPTELLFHIYIYIFIED